MNARKRVRALVGLGASKSRKKHNKAPKRAQPKIVVLGSAVMDFVFRVREIPNWKQAVQANDFQMFPGGKALNQSVAAARLGARVHIIGSVGDDSFGANICSSLKQEGVKLSHLKRIKGKKTPVTNVLVNFDGEAAFIGWLNRDGMPITRNHVKTAKEIISSADALLITLEASIDAIDEAVKIAKQHQVRILLNPAPPLDPPLAVSHMLLQDVDWLIPNVWEASMILGKRDATTRPDDLAFELKQRGARNVCVTTSGAGCTVVTNGQSNEYPGYASTPVDTTGGSDAFCAALAIALANGKSVKDAIDYANAAGAIAVGHDGGSPSMPSARQLDSFLASRKRKVTTEEK